jgi:archaellin
VVDGLYPVMAVFATRVIHKGHNTQQKANAKLEVETEGSSGLHGFAVGDEGTH